MPPLDHGYGLGLGDLGAILSFFLIEIDHCRQMEHGTDLDESDRSELQA
jgi:hypothetical protein